MVQLLPKPFIYLKHIEKIFPFGFATLVIQACLLVSWLYNNNLRPQIGARRNVIVLELPHLTP